MIYCSWQKGTMPPPERFVPGAFCDAVVAPRPLLGPAAGDLGWAEVRGQICRDRKRKDRLIRWS